MILFDNKDDANLCCTFLQNIANQLMILPEMPQNKGLYQVGWSMAIVGCIRTITEARIYMKANLKEAIVGDALR